MGKEVLFSEFDPVSSKEFKQKIQYDLKGGDYNETLIWHSNEGIDVKPFYHREDLQVDFPKPQMPSQWFIAESIFILSAAQSAQTANEAVKAGAEAIYFVANETFDAGELFEALEHKDIPLYFQLNFLDVHFFEKVYAFAKMYHINIKLDIINQLASDGNWYQSLSQDYADFKRVLLKGAPHISVDMSLYQNAGATMVQQLAYGLAHLNEYLNYCEQENVRIKTITFEVAVGTNYFFEISKLRGLRILTEALLSEYRSSSQAAESLTKAVKIIAHPTRRNKTVYDYNSNMLRTTTECMSAILGGADWVVNLPYDALYHKTNDFGQRISRNQLIVLREESYFDVVCNPADGSYYIEEITRQLAEKSLDLFKDIEAHGGFLKQLKEGTIQRKIRESAVKEQEQFDNGNIALVGTNKHPNCQDMMKDQLELYPFLKIKQRKTLISPIIPRRLAEALEQERLSKES